jgi:hypothetical protein
MEKLLEFISQLEKVGIHHTLFRSREDAIMVTVNVPGLIWEVEFLQDGEIVIEKFKSDGELYPEDELKVLFRDFSE